MAQKLLQSEGVILCIFKRHIKLSIQDFSNFVPFLK
jgi:hypothetical protein